MKISEISTDSGLDVLCDITPFINNIITDESLLESLKEKVKIKGDESRAEIYAIGVKKINALIPIVFKSHKKDVFGILAALNGIEPEDVAKQNILKTAAQIRDIVKDKDFIDFFKSCVEREKSE